MNSACAGPPSHAPCSAAWCGWTLRFGQRGPRPLCPGAFQRHRTYLSGAQTGDSMADMNVHWKGLSRSPLGQPIQARGCARYQGGCCLQPLHTGLPRGKEQGWLNWLQKNSLLKLGPLSPKPTMTISHNLLLLYKLYGRVT